MPVKVTVITLVAMSGTPCTRRKRVLDAHRQRQHSNDDMAGEIVRVGFGNAASAPSPQLITTHSTAKPIRRSCSF